ncbi:MAG: ABC transporter permease [Myxococcota bacterium]|nr:ABC transporter permease [Myxococcota bacterium]
MRSWLVLQLGVRRLWRDRLSLGLTVLTAPLFVILYWALFSDSAAQHHLALLNEDQAAADPTSRSAQVIQALAQCKGPDGTLVFDLQRVESRASLKQHVIEGRVNNGLVIPADFSSTAVSQSPLKLSLLGNVGSPEHLFVSALVSRVVGKVVRQINQRHPAVEITALPLGLSAERTPFERYVPGLLVFSVIMLIFSASMAVVRDVEAGTLARLRLTPVRSFELVLGFFAVQLCVGGASVLLTLGVAFGFGFRSAGSIPLAMAVAAMASMANIGIGMVIASLSKTQTRAFLLASAVMFLLVLFSGIVFPRPEVSMFQISGRSIDLFHLLPTTHMSEALTKVLTLGARASDVTYELAVLAGIAMANFGLGSALFAFFGRPSNSAWEGLP